MSAIWQSIWRGDIWESVWATPWGTAVAPGPGPSADALLLETGHYLLLETGFYLLLEFASLPSTHESFSVSDGGGADFHVSDGAGGDEIFGVLK
jgi:hypothetical protein